MFNISGTPFLPPSQRPEDTALALRLNQRITAEVLQITGEKVTLAIDGVRIVATLTTADQAAALQNRRFAQFVIKDLNPNQVLIALAPPLEQTATPVPAAATQDLARILLAQMKMPENASNLTILRSMLANGLPADANILNEIQTALAGMKTWGAPDANAAAMLKAAGLPITPGTLSLVMTAPQETAQAFSRLLGLLQGLSTRQLPPQAGEALRQAIATLQAATPEWSQNAAAMAPNLRQAVALLGRSLEAGLAQNLLPADAAQALAKDGGQGRLLEAGLAKNLLPEGAAAALPKDGLLSLLALRRELAQSGPREVIEAIDRFLDSTRLQQFKSSALEPTPGRSEWISLHLPLHLQPPPDAAQARYTGYQEARLKISCRREGDGRQVDAGFTRILVAIDFDQQDAVEVNLSIVAQKIGVQVTASSSNLCNLAKEELSAFTRGLNELGFDLLTSRFEVGQAQEDLHPSHSEISPEKYLAIDLEI